MKIGTSGSMHAAKPWLKIMTYGHSGAGKTHWSTTAPKPLFLLTEIQAMATIQAVRPDAVIIEIHSWRDFCQAMKLVKTAKHVTLESGQPASQITVGGSDYTFQTLVIDSFTDVQRLMIASLLKEETEMLNIEDMAQLTTPQWGKVLTTCERVLQDQRNLHCNTVVIFLAFDQYDKEDVRRVMPMVNGRKLPGMLGQYFNAVGYQTIDRKLGNALVWRGGSRFVTKPAPGFPKKCSADVTLGSLALAALGAHAPHEPDDVAYVATVETKKTINNNGAEASDKTEF